MTWYVRCCDLACTLKDRRIRAALPSRYVRCSRPIRRHANPFTTAACETEKESVRFDQGLGGTTIVFGMLMRHRIPSLHRSQTSPLQIGRHTKGQKRTGARWYTTAEKMAENKIMEAWYTTDCGLAFVFLRLKQRMSGWYPTYDAAACVAQHPGHNRKKVHCCCVQDKTRGKSWR